jgi:hypothetical protein
LGAGLFFFIGVPQHKRSRLAQPQSSSTVTRRPHSEQAYLPPTLEADFLAGLAALAGVFGVIFAIFISSFFLIQKKSIVMMNIIESIVKALLTK